MTKAVAKKTDLSAAEIMETVIVKGDLSNLTPQERSEYYAQVCKSIGLNPLSRPLEYLELDGRLTLYARKDAAEQLRAMHNISVEILSREEEEDLLIVHARAINGEGRSDEDYGAVLLQYPEQVWSKKSKAYVKHPRAGKPLKGVERANAIMKCVTKSKRRVTLSLAGLGFLDETEVEDVDRSAEAFTKEKPEVIQPASAGEQKPLPPRVGENTPDPVEVVDEQTGEIIEEIAIEEDDGDSDVLTDYLAAIGRANTLKELSEFHKMKKPMLERASPDEMEQAKSAFEEMQAGIRARRKKTTE